MLSLDRIIGLTYTITMSRCRGCVNHCVLTINRFEGGRQYISGNRCERGLGVEKAKRISRIFIPINITGSSITSLWQPTRPSAALWGSRGC